jgi:hypothetical protein
MLRPDAFAIPLTQLASQLGPNCLKKQSALGGLKALRLSRAGRTMLLVELDRLVRFLSPNRSHFLPVRA